MNLLQTLILSLIEGITEFLPISSTGHLILSTHALQIPQTEFVKSFEIIIQLGAILAIFVLYFKKLLNTKLWPTLLAAFIPSAAVGFVFYKLIKESLIGNSLITVIALFLGGVAFILIENWHKNLKNEKQIESLEKISLKNAFVIGLFQSISIVPGVSRAGATILGAMILKTNRKVAAEFSFLLAVPTMFAATGLDIMETKLDFSSYELFLLTIGFIASFIFAILSVKLLIKYLTNHSFTFFGVYRIILAIIFWLVYLR